MASDFFRKNFPYVGDKNSQKCFWDYDHWLKLSKSAIDIKIDFTVGTEFKS